MNRIILYHVVFFSLPFLCRLKEVGEIKKSPFINPIVLTFSDKIRTYILLIKGKNTMEQMIILGNVIIVDDLSEFLDEVEEDPCVMTEDEWAEMLYYDGLEG